MAPSGPAAQPAGQSLPVPDVVSLGQLCAAHGYTFEWSNGMPRCRPPDASTSESHANAVSDSVCRDMTDDMLNQDGDAGTADIPTDFWNDHDDQIEPLAVTLAAFGVEGPPDEQSTTAARSAANTIAEELRSLPDQAFTTHLIF